MRKLLPWRRVARRRLEADVDELIERFGDRARAAATDRMVESARRHDWAENARWTRARAAIDRRCGHRQGSAAEAMGPPGFFSA